MTAHDTAFFGHPRGLSTLFFTEMWERFSYYGMRALLILFMTASVADGGLGFDTAVAGAIYGLYTSMVYMATLPGGWVADRLIGQRRAVLYGGLLIASGHFSMAFPSVATFYLGLFLIVVGTGLLKGNVSVMVGQLYAPRDARRDAGFSIFYMGINLGAFIAPLICGYLGQRVNWHLGFASAGLGMVIGIIQYVLGGTYLSEVSLHPAPAASAREAEQVRRRAKILGLVALVLFVAFGFGTYTGALPITPSQIADAAGYMLLIIGVGFFGWLFASSNWTPEERKRLYAIAVFFLAAAIFWSLFEQAGSTLNLFADRDTRTTILGWSLSEQLVPVDELAVRVVLRPGVRRALDENGTARAVHAGEVLARSDPRGRRLRRARRGGRAGSRRRPGQPALADRGLPVAHLRGALPEPRRSQRDDQAGTRADRRPHDGRLVPGDVGRQLHRRPSRGVLRGHAAADALHQHRDLRHHPGPDPFGTGAGHREK